MIQTPLWANKGGQAVLPYNLYFVQFEENEGLEAKFQKITPVDILFIFNFHEIVSLLKKKPRVEASHNYLDKLNKNQNKLTIWHSIFGDIGSSCVYLSASISFSSLASPPSSFSLCAVGGGVQPVTASICFLNISKIRHLLNSED